MALLWIDGFEGYGPVGTAGLYARLGVRGYTASGSSYMELAVGRITGCAFGHTDSTATATFQTPVLTSDSTLIVGCAYTALNAISTSTLALYDNATLGINITLTPTTPTSTIVLKRGATTLATFTDFTFILGTWYYIEFKVFCHATSGTAEVRLNGVTIISLTGINTQSGTNAWHNMVKVSAYQSQRFDDFYICDSTGTCNDFQGACRVLGLFPDSDTETVQWTTSSGTTHYNLIDENPANTTDYVYTSTQGDTDLYHYPSLIGTGTIIGLQVTSQIILSAGASIIVEAPIVSNGITDLGPDYLLSSASYVEIRHISEIDPNTNQPWTIADLTAAHIGMRVM
jgi:hypothetical protein